MNPRIMKVIDECDVVIEVVDARYADTRCREIENAVKKKAKALIVVKNKADLVV